jgi:tetratricopeptide (TPR) repeat protein
VAGRASQSGPAAGSVPPGGSAAPGGSGDSYGRLREIYARQGDELQVGLDGVGFLFLGFPDRSAQADGMSFKGKEIRNGKTWFTFQALKLGTYDLDFLLQQNTTGKSDKETVRVHVVTEQDFSTAVNQQPGQGTADAVNVETGDPAFAGKLTSLGAYQSAIAELQKGYREGNPGLNDQLAALYMRVGSYDTAATYYRKNLAPSNEFTQRAVLGLVSIAIAKKDHQALMASLKQFLAIRDPSAEEPLIRSIRMETDRAETGLALDLAAEYAATYPNGRWRDESDFLTANLLEMNSQFRDIARARELYRSILTRYPESAFAAAARARLSYIDRHFFQVR